MTNKCMVLVSLAGVIFLFLPSCASTPPPESDESSAPAAVEERKEPHEIEEGGAPEVQAAESAPASRDASEEAPGAEPDRSTTAAPAEKENITDKDKESPVEAADAPSLPAAGPHPALLDPAKARETAPDSFKVRFDTTRGSFVVKAVRAWSPQGVDRFYNLVKIGFFDNVAFFRVLDGFVAQFGIHGDPKVNQEWFNASIPDDPVQESNRRGTLTFATGGPNTRTTQLFINLVDNSGLDGRGFSPIAEVVEGMSVVDSLYSEYGEGAPRGSGPSQPRIQSEGNSYLKENFPKLDYVQKATVIP